MGPTLSISAPSGSTRATKVPSSPWTRSARRARPRPRAALPDLGRETFVHGALCISYSGQCYMSGMISERSANRGSCAQSCRKDYVLDDVTNHVELDRGFLISAKDLAATDHLAEIAEA